ncbi:putative MFS family arabinose efflux permease [Brevibacterium sanguinis]|uniref:MFS family arabinose efflux permease n=2 Tax=Brevibacterium TaxID=1696 RepID=A0ABX9GT95_9MICO|nr:MULTISPECIES: MFS transporter [Brevibacterium]RBP67807.1 putative MFS family arabinose efflux permease [Brevibacterium sanguinis]RBP74776.1 putative MFS family arabinose efflux permease [Brevibacterium celere]
MSETSMSVQLDRGDDPNSMGRIALIMAFASLGALLLLAAPIVAIQLQQQLKFSPSQTGDLFAVELGATALASIPALYWVRRINLRKAALSLGLIYVVGNAISVFLTTFETLIVVRGVTSFAGGSLMVLSMMLAAQARNRDRMFGYWTVGQLALGAIGLATLPLLFSAFGIAAFYLSMGVLMALSILLVRYLPPRPLQSPTNRVEAQTAPPVNVTKVVIALVACLLFYVGLISVWTFMGGFAEAAGIAPEATSLYLALATAIGVATPIAAISVGGALNRRVVLVGGYGVMVIGVALLVNVEGAVRFVICALAIKAAWGWVLPFLMSTLGDLDPLGRASNLANLGIAGGLAIGPFVAGRIVEATGGFNALIFLALPTIVASLVLIVLSQPRRSKPDSVADSTRMARPSNIT